MGQHGFVDIGGQFTTLDGPGSTLTYALGINASGSIVGAYADATGFHGYVDTPMHGA